MNILNIGTDREILNPHSDVRERMLLYAPFVGEMHLHCTTKGKSREYHVEQIAENIWIYSAPSWVKSFSLLRKIIKERSIDVIVAPDPFAKAWIALLLAKLYRKRFLLSVYGGNIFDAHWKKLSVFNRIYSWLGRIVFNAADAIQTDGLETLDVLVQKYGKKVFWKPMVPANMHELLAIPRNAQDIKVKPNILYVGRLIEQKNIPFLARVINALKDQATFTIIGDGPLRDMLPHDDIRYFARQSREEIVERFAEADALILTSYFEGFARVMMEAALAGIPVITTRVSGIEGIVVNDVSGFVIEQGDEQGFIDALKLVIANVNKRTVMGQHIREIARTKLSTGMMTEKQKEVYDYLRP